MIFSAKELEIITQGRWKNLKSDMNFHSFNFNLAHAKKNDFFITRSPKQFSQLKSGNETKLSELENIGVAAIMIRDIEFNTSLPSLIVTNTKEAFERIAVATREKIAAKVVLVTGSYGKTGFKVRLHQLIGQELHTSIVRNSSNESSGIFKAISTINKNDDVAIIEVGISGLNKAIERSKIIKPDICVITSIGHEHIEKHKTIDNTIFNKAAVTQNLSQNGIVVIPKDQHFEKLKAAILTHNLDAIIKTFGNDKTCDAYIIKKEFVDFGWDVQASIEGKIVEYHIPFIEIQSAEASLNEFLVANLLSINLDKITPKYKKIKNYKSSGILYNLKYNGKKFYLYDQSRRGGIEGYKLFLKSIKNIKPKGNSKKIVITSEFVDIQDGEQEYIDIELFKELITEAHIDALYTVENFTIHDDVVANKKIWKGHYKNVEELSNIILNKISDGDVVCVKAIFESSMRDLVKKILQESNSASELQPSSAITLTNTEIEKATKGQWVNKPKEILIERVTFNVSEIHNGDLYFPYDTEQWLENSDKNSNLIKSAFKRGAVAIVLPSNTKIKTSTPTLLVEHLRDAFRAFAKSSTNKTSAIKILVTGSFGKTGFKKQLYTLIQEHEKTFAFLNSANKSLPIYRTLASIPKDSEVVIVEVAAPGYSIAKHRARYVTPDIAVITNIGPEHLRQHGGSIENVIENKSRVAYGVKDGGLMIIPNQQEYATKEKMIQYIHKINPTIEILTFGEGQDNHGYILEKEFTGYGWHLKVQVKEKEITFTLPFLEEYSVKAVLPILLVCDKLNLDLEEVVQEYKNYKHFASSGNFYKITLNKKTFYLYDQSIRGILDGFKETLQIIGRMKPEKKGKKIALFSEFINFDESSVDVINVDEFKELFQKSGLQSLFTVNMFCEHINVVQNKSIWKEHKFQIDDIIDTVIEDIEEDDILFIRATQKSKANKLVEKILKDASSVQQYY